jgi:hypothetical protein
LISALAAGHYSPSPERDSSIAHEKNFAGLVKQLSDDLKGLQDGKEGYAELGKRFAGKAVELVKKGKQKNGNSSQKSLKNISAIID